MKNKIHIFFIILLSFFINLIPPIQSMLTRSKSSIHNKNIVEIAKKHFANRDIPGLKKVLSRAESKDESTQRGATFELEAALESEQKFNETVEGLDLAFCFYEKINHSSKEKTERHIPDARLKGNLIELPITEYDVITSLAKSRETNKNTHGYLIECKSGKNEPRNSAQLEKQYNVSCWFKEIQKAIKAGFTSVEISIQSNNKGIPLLRLKGESTNNQEIFVLCNWITKLSENPLEKWNIIIDIVANRTLVLLNRGPISDDFPSRLPFKLLCQGLTYFSPPSSPFNPTDKIQQS